MRNIISIKITTKLDSKLVILASVLIFFLAAGCQKVELKKEIPSSPKESYEELPK